MSQDLLTPLLTVEQSAEFLGMSETFVKKQIKEGQLRTVRLGRSIRIDRIDLQLFIQGCKSVVKTVDTPCAFGESLSSESIPQVAEKTVSRR